MSSILLDMSVCSLCGQGLTRKSSPQKANNDYIAFSKPSNQQAWKAGDNKLPPPVNPTEKMNKY
jgi:hypothetical protein